MRVNFIEVIVGAIVLVVAGAFFSYAYKANRPERSFHTELTATFERVDGVLVGTDVKLRGIKVGEVKSMDLKGEKLMAELTFGFFKDVKIPVDSSAEISSEGLMGSKYIAIVPGTSEKTLQTGEEISYTQSSVSLESLIAKYVFSSGGKES